MPEVTPTVPRVDAVARGGCVCRRSKVGEDAVVDDVPSSLRVEVVRSPVWS